MNINDVINRFALISDLSDTQISKWLPICKDSLMYIKSIKKDVQLSKHDEMRLANAAGVLAYYKYCLYSQNNDISSFNAGDVQIAFNSNVTQNALKVWEQEQKDISDLILDDKNPYSSSAFFFKRVVS